MSEVEPTNAHVDLSTDDGISFVTDGAVLSSIFIALVARCLANTATASIMSELLTILHISACMNASEPDQRSKFWLRVTSKHPALIMSVISSSTNKRRNL